MNQKTISGIMLLLLLGMIISLVPVYATETKISVVPTCVTASPGETFTVNITVNNVSNLHAWQIVIEYNNTVLNFTDAWLPEDNVFKDKNHLTLEPCLHNFETYAFVVYGSILFNEPVIDVPEVGILCSLNFTVLQNGHSFLRIATEDDPALPPGAWQAPDGNWYPYEFYTMLLDIDLNEMAFIEESGAVLSITPPLQVSISPLSASILVGQSVTFTSTVSGGVTPYSYQWYLNGNPVSGASMSTWTFSPTASGIYYVYLKVTDAKGNTTQSDTAHITVSAVPVGGYSLPIKAYTTTKPLTLYLALIAILTASFTIAKRRKKQQN
jgi:hypothetical protein